MGFPDESPWPPRCVVAGGVRGGGGGGLGGGEGGAEGGAALIRVSGWIWRAFMHRRFAPPFKTLLAFSFQHSP
jgi:hypothetical protein